MCTAFWTYQYHVIPFCANQSRIDTAYTEMFLFLLVQSIAAEEASSDLCPQFLLIKSGVRYCITTAVP